MLRFDIALHAIRKRLKPAAEKPPGKTGVLIPFPGRKQADDVSAPSKRERRQTR